MTTTLQPQTAAVGCIASINRCLELIRQTDNAQFTIAPEGHGSIGEHLRHCIDHFDCFFRDFGSGAIDYDARTRSREIETNRTAACCVLEEILHSLQGLSAETMQRAVRVRQTAAPDEPPIETGSSITRELMFLSGHTVHHLALMVLIAERAGATPSTELGVAYSTLAYRAERTE